MSELKPCPFCGGEPTSQRGASSYNPGACCYTKGCVLEARWFPIDDWNTRPIEDALQARIAELKELLDTESQLSNQFYLLLVDNPKSKKLADDLIEALRINGKEVQE